MPQSLNAITIPDCNYFIWYLLRTLPEPASLVLILPNGKPSRQSCNKKPDPVSLQRYPARLIKKIKM
jgi:hypothetical protein